MAYKIGSLLTLGQLKSALFRVKYGKATETADGLMPKEDKAKVNKMPTKINGTAFDGTQDLTVFAKIKVVSSDPASPAVGDVWIKTS